MQTTLPIRCPWCNVDNPIYVAYHDHEWGIPVHDDHQLFEMLILEGFQAGLSWECILNKRQAFRKAFDNFDYTKVAQYNDQQIDLLLHNKDIVRNRLKITAAVTNAQVFMKIQEEYGTFDNYLWHFNNFATVYEYDRTTSPLSDAISHDLKRRGMRFVGTTIIYSYLQAIGIINSHFPNCFLFSNNSIPCN